MPGIVDYIEQYGIQIPPHPMDKEFENFLGVALSENETPNLSNILVGVFIDGEKTLVSVEDFIELVGKKKAKKYLRSYYKID